MLPAFDPGLEALANFAFLFGFLTLGVLLAVTALAIAWGGRRLGMTVGVLALASCLLGLTGLLLMAPHLWWFAVLPLGAGVASVRAWYGHTGSATARWPRFDLRELFFLVLLISLTLAGAAANYRQLRDEEAAATVLESLPEDKSIQINWRFGRVTEVIFFKLRDPADFDQAAEALERFSQLDFLQINEPLPGRVTQRIARLTTLRSLSAQEIPMTDDDLQPLANLQNLEYLHLKASHLTDAGLVHLSSLRQLRSLYLRHDDQITPTAMQNLRAGLPNLDHP